MPRALRVLLVDDSVYDCMVAVKRLRQGGFDPRYVRVDSMPALTEAIAAGPWDVLLCDNAVAGMELGATIPLIRRQLGDVPIIVLSEAAGDQVALAAMTAGAQDFVVRDDLDRLIPSLERALSSVQESRERRDRAEQPRKTEELLRLLMEASSEIITVIAADGVIKYCTPSLESALGYRPEELAGASAATWVHPDDHAAFDAMLAQVGTQPGSTHHAELRLRHKDGSWRTLDCVARNLLDHPSVAGIVLDARDVTARKQADAGRARGDTVEPLPIDTTVTQLRRTAEPAELCDKWVGRYRVLRVLGEGGMGTVYQAHDPKLDRLVALKIPRFDAPKANLGMIVERFLREAKSAAQVRHPNICTIYDVDELDGVPFVVMAFVDGQSLADSIRERRRFDDAAEAVRLIRQVLCGLRAVHAHGIVHRDLKPANILLDRDGQALLTDFGIARPEHDTHRLTMHGAVLGTPGYMAPEQAASESDQIGPWTDLYSLGVVLYCMLTGRLPYQGSALTMLLKQLDEPPTAPRALRPDLDVRLEAIVLRAMARHRLERYQTAQQLIDVLDAWLAAPNPHHAPTQTPSEGAFLGDI